MRRCPAPEGPRRHRRRAVLAAIARREWLLRVLALTVAGCRRALVRRWKATADPDALDRIHGEIVDIFRQDLPVTFLFPGLLTSFAHRRIRGLNTPWGELFAKPEDLWIED